MNLGHAGPPIIQRPWGSARSPPLAGSGEAKKTKDPAERRSGDGSARPEQPFNLLEPEAGVARPLVDLDPRRAFIAQDCFQHGALHSAHAPDPQPGGSTAQICSPASETPCELAHTPLTFFGWAGGGAPLRDNLEGSVRSRGAPRAAGPQCATSLKPD